MTHAKKTACLLRWSLFILWLLCLACGAVWLFAPLFHYGAGLAGTPNIAVFGPAAYLFDDSNWGYTVLAVVYLGLFLMTQWLFLSPRHLWKIKLAHSARPMKRAALAAAFAVTLLSVGLLYSVLDLFGDSTVADTAVADTAVADMSESSNLLLRYAFLLIPLILWCAWSVLFCIYFRQSDHYSRTGRLIRALIAGSVLELFVSVPIYATRQEECYCARGSYAGLVFGGTVLLWAFGPGVLLLFIREKQRIEKLLAPR